MKKAFFLAALLATTYASATNFTYGNAIEDAVGNTQEAYIPANVLQGSAVAAEHRVLRAGMRDTDCNGSSLRHCLGDLVLSNCPAGQFWTTEGSGIAHCVYPPPPPVVEAAPTAVYTPDPSPVVTAMPAPVSPVVATAPVPTREVVAASPVQPPVPSPVVVIDSTPTWEQPIPNACANSACETGITALTPSWEPPPTPPAVVVIEKPTILVPALWNADAGRWAGNPYYGVSDSPQEQLEALVSSYESQGYNVQLFNMMGVVSKADVLAGVTAYMANGTSNNSGW